MERKVYENPVIGDKTVFIKTAAETNGEYTLIEVELAPGGGNTLHIHHDFTETFKPIEGDLLIFDGKQKQTLKPGQSATLQVKQPHYFKNPSTRPVKFHVEIRPGHAGFENSLKIAYGLAKDGLTNKKSIPKNFAHLAILVDIGGTHPTGIFTSVMPLFRWKAAKARKQGIEQMLMDKYCR